MSNRFSFDDCGIGRLKNSGRSLARHDIARPNSIDKSDWYKFAGEVINLLNSCDKTKEEVTK